MGGTIGTTNTSSVESTTAVGRKTNNALSLDFDVEDRNKCVRFFYQMQAASEAEQAALLKTPEARAKFGTALYTIERSSNFPEPQFWKPGYTWIVNAHQNAKVSGDLPAPPVQWSAPIPELGALYPNDLDAMSVFLVALKSVTGLNSADFDNMGVPEQKALFRAYYSAGLAQLEEAFGKAGMLEGNTFMGIKISESKGEELLKTLRSIKGTVIDSIDPNRGAGAILAAADSRWKQKDKTFNPLILLLGGAGMAGPLVLGGTMLATMTLGNVPPVANIVDQVFTWETPSKAADLQEQIDKVWQPSK